MEMYEYIFLPLHIIPGEIIEKYGLQDMEKYSHAYAGIQKLMYGIPQEEIIANYFLTKNLALYGYYQLHHTQGLWKNKWIPVTISLVVDDFGVKYVGKQHAEHLVTCIRKYYPVSVDWNGGL